MSNSEERIKAIWEELIVKEQLKTIITKLEEEKLKNKQIIKEELTELWNKSEIPIFKQILEKLKVISENLEPKEEVTNQETNIGRLEKQIVIEKPKLTNGVKKGIDSLAKLHKLGKF